MLPRVKVYRSIFNKYYFWYVSRSLQEMVKKRGMYLEIIEGSFFEEHDHAYELIFINEYPVFIDLRDCFTADKNLFDYYPDFLLLKANYSSELWDMIEKGSYPEGFEYLLDENALKHRKNIKPFMLGRAFTISNQIDSEFTFFKDPQQIKYEIVSALGVGILELQSQSRGKVFDLFDKVFKEKAKLVYFDREHGKAQKRADSINYYVNKYPADFNVLGNLSTYLKFLSSGKYSISVPGIALSTPFRFIDSLLVNRCCISTKIWHDLYKTFPCVELPICGYLGTGDWDKAEEILRNLDKVDYNKMLEDAKDWYNRFLSAEGMWKNQILNSFEEKNNV